MKVIKFILLFIVILGLGYALGNLFPVGNLLSSKAGIKGNTKLEVKLVDTKGLAVTGVEVDVSDKPGPPLPGGSVKTDTKGVATFNIKQGSYSVFFNTINFPTVYKVPKEVPVTVEEGKINQITITLQNI